MNLCIHCESICEGQNFCWNSHIYYTLSPVIYIVCANAVVDCCSRVLVFQIMMCQTFLLQKNAKWMTLWFSDLDYSTHLPLLLHWKAANPVREIYDSLFGILPVSERLRKWFEKSDDGIRLRSWTLFRSNVERKWEKLGRSGDFPFARHIFTVILFGMFLFIWHQQTHTHRSPNVHSLSLPERKKQDVWNVIVRAVKGLVLELKGSPCPCMFTTRRLAKARPTLLDKCLPFSRLSTSCQPASVYLLFSKELKVSIYGRMIQHQFKVVTKELCAVFCWLLWIIALTIFKPWGSLGWTLELL